MTESAHDQARESAKRTNDNSPAIHRWGRSANSHTQSAKRTTETISYHAHLAPFCRPFHGLIGLLSPLTQH